jgi:CRP-like cAMP-binding protein
MLLRSMCDNDACEFPGTFESVLLGVNEIYRPLVPKKLLDLYRRGACFGETELLHDTRRTSTVVCSSVGMIACIPRSEFLVCVLSSMHAACINKNFAGFPEPYP